MLGQDVFYVLLGGYGIAKSAYPQFHKTISIYTGLSGIIPL